LRQKKLPILKFIRVERSSSSLVKLATKSTALAAGLTGLLHTTSFFVMMSVDCGKDGQVGSTPHPGGPGLTPAPGQPTIYDHLKSVPYVNAFRSRTIIK